MILRLAGLTICLLLLCSCTKTTGGTGPHATVYLRNGTSVSGTVTSSNPTEMQIAGDDQTTHTIPMAQVQSINYDQPPAAGGAPAAAPEASGAPAAAPAAAADAVHERHYHPEEAAITTRTFELASGTEISVRNEETIDSGRASEGQTFAAEVTGDVLDASGQVVIPHGANAQIVIKSTSRGGRFRGASDMVLDLDSVSVAGRRYRLNASDVVERGKEGIGKNRRTAEYTGGGAVVGALIGAIAGRGKGAAIGAASGAGAGALTQAFTKGSSIKVPVESVLTFRLESPLRVVAAQ